MTLIELRDCIWSFKARYGEFPARVDLHPADYNDIRMEEGITLRQVGTTTSGELEYSGIPIGRSASQTKGLPMLTKMAAIGTVSIDITFKGSESPGNMVVAFFHDLKIDQMLNYIEKNGGPK